MLTKYMKQYGKPLCYMSNLTCFALLRRYVEWTKVHNASSPALEVWNANSPVVSGLPTTIAQSDFGHGSYMVQLSDMNASVAARNGDGYPCLVSKNFGDSGVLVYYTYCTPHHHNHRSHVLKQSQTF